MGPIMQKEQEGGLEGLYPRSIIYSTPTRAPVVSPAVSLSFFFAANLQQFAPPLRRSQHSTDGFAVVHLAVGTTSGVMPSYRIS